MRRYGAFSFFVGKEFIIFLCAGRHILYAENHIPYDSIHILYFSRHKGYAAPHILYDFQCKEQRRKLVGENQRMVGEKTELLPPIFHAVLSIFKQRQEAGTDIAARRRTHFENRQMQQIHAT